MSKKKELKRFDLSKPFNPSDIKGLSEDELNDISKQFETLFEDISDNKNYIKQRYGLRFYKELFGNE